MNTFMAYLAAFGPFLISAGFVLRGFSRGWKLGTFAAVVYVLLWCAIGHFQPEMLHPVRFAQSQLRLDDEIKCFDKYYAVAQYERAKQCLPRD